MQYNIDIKKKDLKNIVKNLDYKINNLTIDQKKELIKFTRLLESNSLHTTLKKGYSIVRKAKKIIKESKSINQEDLINIQFLDKSVNMTIKKIQLNRLCCKNQLDGQSLIHFSII